MIIADFAPSSQQTFSSQIAHNSQLVSSLASELDQYQAEKSFRSSSNRKKKYTIRHSYPNGNYVNRVVKWHKNKLSKSFYAHSADCHETNKYGYQVSKVDGYEQSWLPYRAENFPLAIGNAIVMHEGEKCVDYCTNLGIVSTTLVGSKFTHPTILNNLIKCLKNNHIYQIIYLVDHDQTGIDKGIKVAKFCQENGIQVWLLPVEYLFRAIDKPLTEAKGQDFVDFYNELPEANRKFDKIQQYFVKAIQLMVENHENTAHTEQTSLFNTDTAQTQVSGQNNQQSNQKTTMEKTTMNKAKLNPTQASDRPEEKVLEELTEELCEERTNESYIALLACLSKADRDLIKEGVTEGSRNTNGVKLAKNLLGTAQYLESKGYKTDNPYELFSEYCLKCVPSLPNPEKDNIYQNAKQSNPTSTLTEEYLENCISAWKKKVKQKLKQREKQRSPEEKKEIKNQANQLREILSKHYHQRFKYNELKDVVELDGEEADLDLFYLEIEEEHGLLFSKNLTYDVVVKFAKKRSYHPVKEYLESLKLDPNFSINNLSQLYFGTIDPIYDLMLKIHLISSIKRIYQAGCKKDEMLVLKGEQGARKSTFFKVLYGEDFFTDSLTGLDKDNLMILQKHWCVELAELETITGKKAAGELKAFMSSSEDCFRKPYGRTAHTYKRQSILVGTVNKDSFLVDETGSRRFTVIPIQCQQINIDLLEQERDKIWAMAYHLYQQGERCHFTKEEETYYQQLNTTYEHEDSWTEMIEEYLKNKDQTTVKDIFTQCLDMEEKDIQRKDENRVANCLKEIGFEKGGRKIINGVRRVEWTRKQATPPEVWQGVWQGVWQESNPDREQVLSTEAIPAIPKSQTLDNEIKPPTNSPEQHETPVDENITQIEDENQKPKVMEKSMAPMADEPESNNSKGFSPAIPQAIPPAIPENNQRSLEVSEQIVASQESSEQQIDWKTKIGLRVRTINSNEEAVIEGVDNFGGLEIRFLNSDQYHSEEVYPIHPDEVEILTTPRIFRREDSCFTE